MPSFKNASLAKSIALGLGVMVLAFSVGYFVLAFTEPSESPPLCTTCAVPLHTGSVQQTKTGSLILNTIGNTTGLAVNQRVLIGSTAMSPQYILDVAGAMRLQGTTAPTVANGVIYLDTSNKLKCYQNGAWSDCVITNGTIPGQTLYWNGSAWTANTNIFNALSNVGIGTASPDASYKLHVVGSALITSNIYTQGTIGIKTAPSTYALDVNGDLNLRTSVLRVNGSVGTSGQCLTSNGTTVAWGSCGTGNVDSGTVDYQTLRWNNTTLRWVASSNLLNNDTNVGIGVSPSYKLDVNGSVNLRTSTLYIAGSAGTSGQCLTTNGTTVAWASCGGNVNNGTVIYQTLVWNTSTLKWEPSSNILNNYSTNNVGIGTTPSYKLDVNGDLNLRTSVLRVNGSVGTSGQCLTTNGTTVVWGSCGSGGGIANGTIPGQTLYWNGSAWTANTNIFNALSNVGIGTASPDASYKLHVVGSALITSNIYAQGTIGIKTAPSTYALDVNGDLNLRTSVLRVNGSLGSNGQCLTTNGSTVSWGGCGTGNNGESVDFPEGLWAADYVSAKLNPHWLVPNGYIFYMTSLTNSYTGGSPIIFQYDEGNNYNFAVDLGSTILFSTPIPIEGNGTRYLYGGASVNNPLIASGYLVLKKNLAFPKRFEMVSGTNYTVTNGKTLYVSAFYNKSSAVGYIRVNGEAQNRFTLAAGELLMFKIPVPFSAVYTPVYIGATNSLPSQPMVLYGYER